ncbi:MAG: hypothetical protein HOQ17_17500 [Gemmatimonadaceae bacterium]|nr:hypothetical protein [Gemmatimonadaceae bacterium]NUO92925.1 hypothetical protein [Gemmatimonadaceae bacterium]NUR33181.1 hypothetical protein [Gemmatimonadaceae bacterium]NUS34841.1 hypothetical protein [Gemmatimonadaceae bacterium]
MAERQNKRARRSEQITRTGRRNAASGRGSLPAIGLEAEFATVIDGVPQRPEDVFGSPRRIVRGPLVHRTGRSYHLPTGGAVYFDTGVIEIATPMIEIARGCGARGTRSLWESLAFLRSELDAWEADNGREVRLVGFSAHYNVSFDLPREEAANGRSVEQLAYLLTHLLAAPVMLLAANRRSTGVGVRPRGNRIEITADFTPDAALMAATATFIVAVVREVMTWPSYDVHQLDAREIPVVKEFVPVPHSSRKGWVARYSCFPANPFTADVDSARWTTRGGERMSLRGMAGRTTRRFWPAIRAMGDPLSLRLIAAVMRGRAPSLLELDDRPLAYDDVGRLCTWNDLFPVTLLPRSRYERVLGNAIAGHRVRMGGAWHKPVGMKGWTHVVFRREKDGTRHVRSLDDMLMHLDAWDRSAERRAGDRRRSATGEGEVERRRAERRAQVIDTLERRRESDAELLPETPGEVVNVLAAPPIPAPASPRSPAPPPRPSTGRNEAPLVIITRTS